MVKKYIYIRFALQKNLKALALDKRVSVMFLGNVSVLLLVPDCSDIL